jgi:hypothetical protein
VTSPKTIHIPTQSAHLLFDSTMNRTDSFASLGFDISAKTHFGLADASASASFSRKLTNNAFSISMVYQADYAMGIEKLDENSLNWLVPKDSPDWITRCGDEFALQKETGGQLFLLYRIDFSSVDAKQSFSASFSGSYGASSVNAKVDSISNSFSGRASVHVEAFQRGGDVSKLSSILGGTAQPAGAVIECNMQNLAPCGAFMAKAIEYASAQGAGTFSDSLNSMAGDRTYLFKDWSMLGVPAERRYVSAEVQIARRAIQQTFDTQLELQDRVAVLRSGRLLVASAVASKLAAYETAAQTNLALLRDSVYQCYDALTDPSNSVQVDACVNASKPENLVPRGYDLTVSLDKLNSDVRLPYLFGGMYQTATCGQGRSGSITGAIWKILCNNNDNIPNPFTGTLGCPAGFSSYLFASGLRPPENQNASGAQYLCLAPQADGMTGWSFTGVYAKDDKPTSNNDVANQFGGAGGTSCPAGTGTPHWFGRTMGPESRWGVSQFFCSLDTKSTERMPFGGMYQVDDCGRSNTVNPMTGGLGCPDGFGPVQMGRVLSSGNCGVVQYVCKPPG